jgi:hypothetical protein
MVGRCVGAALALRKGKKQEKEGRGEGMEEGGWVGVNKKN